MTKISDNRNWVDANYLYTLYIYMHHIHIQLEYTHFGILAEGTYESCLDNLEYNVFQKLWLA